MSRKSKRKYLIIALVALFLSLTTAAMANSQVTLKVKPGFNGVYKMSALVPLQITIENKGTDLSGYLVLANDRQHPYNEETEYAREVFIAAGSTEIIEFLLPGNVVANRNQLNFVVGDNLLAWAPVQGLVVRGEGILVLGVSDRGELYKPLLEAQDKGGSLPRLLTGKTIGPADLPEDLFILQGADIIVLDEQVRTQLTPAQEEALERWVRAGGALLISPGVDGLKNDSDVLGRVMVAKNDKPLFYRQYLGQGVIITSTYDLLGESGLDKKEEWQLWQEILNSELFQQGLYYHEGFWGTAWSYIDAANMFDSVSAPKLLLFGGILGVYLLIVGPAIYLVLRRMDKRDWAWLAVPGIALILAGGIMGVGNARIPGDGIMQTVSTINIAGKGVAVAEGAASAIVPKGGEYSFAASSNTYAIPVKRGRTAGEMAVIINKDEDKIVAFNQVEYWSVRNAAFRSLVTHLGQIEGNLTLQEDLLSGTLVNNTGLDLKDVVLTAGSKVFTLGDWPQGDKRELRESLGWVQGNDSFINRDYYSPVLRRNLTQQQERLLNAGNYYAKEVYYGPRPVYQKDEIIYPAAREGLVVKLSGWAKDDLDFVEVFSLQASSSSLHLINQNLPVDLGGEDKVFYPWRTIHPLYQGSVEYTYYTPDQSGIVLQGSIQADFNIGLNLEVDRLYTNFYAHPLTEATGAIYNWQTKEWDSLIDRKLEVITGDDASLYISDEGKLRVRFINNKGSREYIPEPAIQVLGRVSQ